MSAPRPAPATPGRALRALAALRTLPWSAPLAMALVLVLFTNRQELARHLLQLLLVWVPLLLLLHLPTLVRSWNKLLLLLAGLALAITGLALVGPALVQRFAMPLYNLDLDHRPKPAAGRFNQDGVAPDQPPESYQDRELVIVFLGDSFTQGYELEDPLGGFPFLVEQLLRQRHPDQSVRVANFGWVSSSPILQARQLRDIGARYHPDIVVQCLDMTDFANDLRYAEELEAKGLDSSIDISIFEAADIWFSWTLGLADIRAWLRDRLAFPPPAPTTAQPDAALEPFFPMLRPLEQSRGFMDFTWSQLLATRDISRDLGARYALVVLPRYQQFAPSQCPGDWEGPESIPASSPHLREPFRYIDERSGEADFPVWPLLDAFTRAATQPLVFDHDPHYNPAGHQVAAQEIAAQLEVSGLLTP